VQELYFARMSVRRGGLPKFALVGLLLLPRSAGADGLQLEDAVRQALANNERAAKAPLRVEVAEGGLERARGAFLPSLVLGGQTQFASKSQGTGALTLTQPIFSPSAFPLYSAAKHTLYAERWGAEQDRRVLAYDTAKAFFQALAADRLKQAADRRLATAKSNLDYAEARSTAGLTSSNDVTRAQVAMASAMTAVASAEGTVARAYLNLSFLTTKPVTSGISSPEHLTKVAQTYDPKDSDIKAALDRRFDVKSSHERVESFEASAKEPLYRLAPSLSASGSLRLDPDPIYPSKLSAVATINLTWTIYDGGIRYADRKTRLAQAASAAYDEAALRRSVETDVKVALASLKAARAAFKIADDAVAAAQKSVDETSTLYTQGLAKAIEMTDANLTRFDAEVTRASARVTMEQAYLDLRLALGYGPLDA